MRQQIRQLALFVFFSTCYSAPEDLDACVGNNITIPWVYPDSVSMNTVSWEHFDSSNVKTTILLHFAGSAAIVQGGYNIQHNSNGNVTITTATVTNTGTYRITVSYTSATPTFTDDVVVNVYDPPTDFNFTESASGTQTTFTCTAGSLGDPAADLYIQVNGVNSTAPATVSETDTVKCILSGPSVQCMSEVSGTVTSLCVQCPTTEVIYICPGLGNSTVVNSVVKCTCVWILICVAILLGIILIGIALGCLLTRASCCCACFYDGESCKNCVNNCYCSCKCCASTPCGACCNIEGLPYWYQVLWASIIGIPIALGILLVWKCCNNEPHRNDSTNKSSGDVPLNTKYSN